MEQIIETKRYYRQHFSQVKKSDTSTEEFDTIRGGIAFPQEKTPGLILAGGILRDKEVIKIVAEKEFNTLSEAVMLVGMFYEKLLPYALYYQDIPENEAFAVFLQRNNPHGLLIRPAPYTENLDFGIPLINDYLANNKLLVPRNSIIAKQLETNWESFVYENGSHSAITALFSLLSGLANEPWNKGLFSEANLEQCYSD